MRNGFIRASRAVGCLAHDRPVQVEVVAGDGVPGAFCGPSEPAGAEFLFKVDMQINPDILGGNGGRIAVYDGETEIVATEIAITVLP